MSWARELEYRFNFFLWRLRSFIGMTLLYFVWFSLTLKGKFAGFTEAELFTYVFGANILRSIIFGSQTRNIAEEINNGWFSRYLLMPINHFWFEFFRELAQRTLNFISSIFEVGIFILIAKPNFILEKNFSSLTFFFFSIILALFLYYLLSYLVSLVAFWSREAMGPRFLFEWLLEFSSGAYFPLSVFSEFLFFTLMSLPFAYLLYFPLSIYLEKMHNSELINFFALELIWIFVIAFITKYIWSKGLKRFTGEGI